MATVALMLDERYPDAQGSFPLVVRVHHKGKRKYVPVGFKLRDNQFKNGKVINHPDAKIKDSRASSKLSEIKKYIADCELHNKPIRMDLIGTGKTSASFCDYLEKRAEQYKAKGQIVMWQKLNRFISELKDCFKGDVLFDDMDQDALRKLDAYMIKAGNVENTRHKKFKFLRQFFGQAIDEGKVTGTNPFKQYYIPIRPVRKDKLTTSEIENLEQIKLSAGPVNDARNLFLFSYYAKGARFENCVTLRKKQIHQGRINIVTNKSGKHISVLIHSRLQKILSQYKGKDFLFPFISELPEDPHEYLSLIGSLNTVVNRNLKILAGLCGIKTKITFHIARHSFAYHLKKVTNNMHIIQEALVHSNQRTTETYLKSLGDEVLDVEMEKLYGR
jgi:site-specific recombinase XerD